MLHTPFYDPNKSYDENYDQGPFGAFADGKIFKQEGEPQNDFLGQKVYLPFGIPAGPLLNFKYCKAAFDKGFDICVYKTVRAEVFPCHAFPNILSVNIEGNLTLDKAKGQLVADNNYKEPLSITNSFGVPSKKPEVWQEDVKKAISFAGKGQVLVLSFMGTVKENQTPQQFLEDWAQAAKLSKETGAKILEANLSCPNIGNEGLVCYNLEMTEKVCQVIRQEIGDTPLILKVGFYDRDEDLEKLTQIAQKYAQAIAAINTISAEVVDSDGNQALPGKNRIKSGVCGASIKWAGLDMVRKLKLQAPSPDEVPTKSRQSPDKVEDTRWNRCRGHSMESVSRTLDGIGVEDTRHSRCSKFQVQIIGVGGVTKPEDYFEYREAGADCVMSATGSMWNPYLAQGIKVSR